MAHADLARCRLGSMDGVQKSKFPSNRARNSLQGLLKRSSTDCIGFFLITVFGAKAN